MQTATIFRCGCETGRIWASCSILPTRMRSNNEIKRNYIYIVYAYLVCYQNVFFFSLVFCLFRSLVLLHISVRHSVWGWFFFSSLFFKDTFAYAASCVVVLFALCMLLARCCWVFFCFALLWHWISFAMLLSLQVHFFCGTQNQTKHSIYQKLRYHFTIVTSKTQLVLYFPSRFFLFILWQSEYSSFQMVVQNLTASSHTCIRRQCVEIKRN